MKNRLMILAALAISVCGQAQLFPMKEVYGKKPMKLDPSLKPVAQKLDTRRQGGFSQMFKYDFGEYTMQDVSHKPVKTEDMSFGFIVHSGKSKQKTGFGFTITDHKLDTARVVSTLVIQDEYSGTYLPYGDIEFTRTDKSSDIYSSNLRLTGDTSHWEILVKDRMRFMERSEPEVIGAITNGTRRLLIRLVAEMESGDAAKLTAPGFEVLENGKALMAVQYVGPPMKEPIIWLQPDLSHGDRFLLISAAASLVVRIDEANAGKRMDGM